MKKLHKLLLLMLLTFPFTNILPKDANRIVVAADGTGDFKTISDAIHSLPMYTYGRVVIFIKNGVYEEKFRIENDHLSLIGEDREKTIIKYSQLRTDWDKNKDAVGPGVINIFADDVVLENLTIENTQPQVGPHAFTIYGFGTRTIIYNCNVISKGGDTVSLWNYKEGLYYHAKCYFEGSVDFVCPRGWCFIRDSKFYELLKTAAIWHAGGYDKDQKFVIWNSSFDGTEGFDLGRHHYEAQFYLLDCSFSKNMSDKPIFRAFNQKDPTYVQRSYNWGDRIYYYNCHKDGGDLPWFKNNLNDANGSPKPEDITPLWTFDGKWDPESTAGPKILNYNIDGDSLYLNFSERVTMIGVPVLKSDSGKEFVYYSGGENTYTRFIAKSGFTKNDLKGLKIINNAEIIASVASVHERNADLSIK